MFFEINTGETIYAASSTVYLHVNCEKNNWVRAACEKKVLVEENPRHPTPLPHLISLSPLNLLAHVIVKSPQPGISRASTLICLPCVTNVYPAWNALGFHWLSNSVSSKNSWNCSYSLNSWKGILHSSFPGSILLRVLLDPINGNSVSK